MKEAEIIETLETLHSEGKRLFVTSSFQTHSIPLLHIIARSALPIHVYCLNTGFLMPETLTFADEVCAYLGIELRQIFSSIPRYQQRDANGNFYFTSDPDYCCHINKVEPTARLLDTYDVWINGIRADQNANRRSMQTFQPTGSRAMRYHPMLNWSGKEIYDYIKTHNLPRHPLDAQGYASIGCEPCTRKALNDDPRAARWFGLNKTECGLHTTLAKK
jgi:phosphoadenosine phosphosulfate reductase